LENLAAATSHSHGNSAGRFGDVQAPRKLHRARERTVQPLGTVEPKGCTLDHHDITPIRARRQCSTPVSYTYSSISRTDKQLNSKRTAGRNFNQAWAASTLPRLATRASTRASRPSSSALDKLRLNIEYKYCGCFEG
jgi:hypothetical protein